MTKDQMLKGLQALDQKIPRKLSLIVGGGGAMVLAHQFPLVTYDIDAVPKGMGAQELDPYIQEVARDLNLPVDWLNPWYSSFTYVLPVDFETRLVPLFSGNNLQAQGLSVDDLLIMKCFAHRAKDIPHAKALLRAGANPDFAYGRMEELEAKGIPGVEKAQAFLDEVLDQEEA